MIKVICEKCRRDDLSVNRISDSEVKVEMPGKTVKVHLCSRCRPRLERWLAEADPMAMSSGKVIRG